MNIDKVKVGDVVLYHGHTWVAKQILKWMNQSRIKKGLPERALFNHAAMIIDLWGSKWLIESVARGVHVIPLTVDMYNGKHIKVKTWVKRLTTNEKYILSRFAIELALENHHYDFLNFIYHMIYISIGKWFGPKGFKARKVIYCSELVAILMDKIRDSFKGETYNKSPLDIDLSNDLK